MALKRVNQGEPTRVNQIERSCPWNEVTVGSVKTARRAVSVSSVRRESVATVTQAARFPPTAGHGESGTMDGITTRQSHYSYNATG